VIECADVTTRQRIWEVLEFTKPGDRAGRSFAIFILSLIFLNVLAVIVGTVDSVARRYGTVLYAFEVVSIAVFTIEYVLRLWLCVSDPRYRGGIRGRLRFAISGMALVDLVSVLPFYLPMLGLDLRFVRIFRLMRIVRIAKIGRYYSSLGLLRDTIRSRKEELVLTFSILMLLLVVSASAIYFVEHDAQPQVFPSIPEALWWSVATLTTVGYGDAYPVTGGGKFLVSVIAVLGIGMFALPTGIIGAGLVEEMRRRRHSSDARRCPHCGREIE
jgi:voltage-gated potassium channel